MRETLTLDFCEITLCDNYMVVVMNEGITVVIEHNNILATIAEDYYKGQPFVYLSHRKNSYSVDPKVYLETSKIENLKGFAVVSSDFKARSNATVEKMFLDKPFAVFSELEEALSWADDLLK